jgi:hypothetical protein
MAQEKEKKEKSNYKQVEQKRKDPKKERTHHD